MFETDADRLEYLTTFGVAAVMNIAPDNWDTTVIFDNEFIDVNGIESRQPVVLARLDDIYKPGELQNIEFRATSVQLVGGGFDIVEVQDDGTGMVVLVLELQ